MHHRDTECTENRRIRRAEPAPAKAGGAQKIFLCALCVSVVITTAAFGQQLSGAPGAVATGGASWRSLADTMTQIGRVTSAAALGSLKTSDYASGVLRVGVNGAVPVLYLALGAACDLGAGGAGDGGFEVASANAGNCWRAVVGPEGADLRLWGATGTANDQATLALADAAMGSANWIGPKRLRIPAGATWMNWYALNVQDVAGPGKYAGAVNLTSTAGTSDRLVIYQGGGPFSFHDFNISCPIYSFSTYAEPGGANAIEVEPPATSTQVSRVKIADNRIIGCGGNDGIAVYSAKDVEIAGNDIDYPWQFGIVVSDANNAAGVVNSNINVHNNVCRMSGAYCVSLPVNQNQLAAAIPAPTNFRVNDNLGVGAGWMFDKFCWDMTTENVENLQFIDDSCLDSYSNVEFKATAAMASSTGTVPYGTRGEWARAFASTHIDSGGNAACGSFASENPTDTTPLHRTDAFADLSCSYLQPPPWKASWGQALGSVVTSGGWVYQALQGGVTGTSAPSTCPTLGANSSGIDTTIGIGLTDGGVVWSCRGALPTNQRVVAALPPGGVKGSGYAANDVLTVSGGTCGSPPTLTPTSLDNGNEITQFGILFGGRCSVLPANPVTLTGGTGTGATANLTWNTIPVNLVAGQVYASSGLQLRYHISNLAYGVELLPEGEIDQTIRDLHLEIEGVAMGACLYDGAPSEYGVQPGYINSAVLTINCKYLGYGAEAPVQLLAANAIPAWAGSTTYYQNDLVTNGTGTFQAECSNVSGCGSAASGGPTGTGNGIADGTNGLTWNYTTQYASGKAGITYRDLEFLGGRIEGAGQNYAFYTAGAGDGAILSGTIKGTHWRGAAGGLYIQDPVTMNWAGGGFIEIGLPSGLTNAAPITLNGTRASGTLTLLSPISVATTAPANGSTNQGVNILASATGAVKGGAMMWRAPVSWTSSPASTACSSQDFYPEITPTTTILSGWDCTTPSTTAGTFTGH